MSVELNTINEFLKTAGAPTLKPYQYDLMRRVTESRFPIYVKLPGVQAQRRAVRELMNRMTATMKVITS